MQPISDDHVAVGGAIRRRRSDKGWSQDALADASEVTRNWIGMIERGEGNLSLTDLMRIARALGVDGAELVAAADRSGSDRP